MGSTQTVTDLSSTPNSRWARGCDSLRDYPRTSESVTWGLIIGLGTLLVALLASIKPKFSREKIGGHFLWLGVSFVGGFILFEGLILLTGILPGISHDLTPAILTHLLIKESIWIVPLALAHMFLVRRSQIAR
jgi:hypothetical protein